MSDDDKNNVDKIKKNIERKEFANRVSLFTFP